MTGPRRDRLRRLRRRRRSGFPAVRWERLALAGAALSAGRHRTKLGLRPAVATAAVAVAPLATAAAISPGRARRAVTWGTQMWAYKIAFEAPHDERERLRRRMHLDYPIAIDSALAGGRPPSQRLQVALRDPPRMTLLDRLLAGVYALWEAEPHLALAYVLWRHPDRFPALAARLAATFDLTLVGYWAVPTAPPWWASEKAGRMDGAVHRVVIELKRELRDEPRPVADHEVGANPWASMPSDHFASALSAGFALLDVNRSLGTGAIAYALALGFALVYLGEHYVADLIAGGALAAGVWAAAPRVEPLARGIAARWPHP